MSGEKQPSFPVPEVEMRPQMNQCALFCCLAHRSPPAFDSLPPVPYAQRPTYRDGVIAVALDEAVDAGGLHFTSAGNSGFGYKFMSVSRCYGEKNAHVHVSWSNFKCLDGLGRPHDLRHQSHSNTKYAFPLTTLGCPYTTYRFI